MMKEGAKGNGRFAEFTNKSRFCGQRKRTSPWATAPFLVGNFLSVEGAKQQRCRHAASRHNLLCRLPFFRKLKCPIAATTATGNFKHRAPAAAVGAPITSHFRSRGDDPWHFLLKGTPSRRPLPHFACLVVHASSRQSPALCWQP